MTSLPKHLASCALFAVGIAGATAPIPTNAQSPPAPQKIGVLYYIQGDSVTELPRVTGKKKTATLRG